MQEELKQRYALSFYVDLRLGIIGDRPMGESEAQLRVADRWGWKAANYARQVAG